MADDYEIIPLKEIKKLKAEIAQLKKEKTGTPEKAIAGSLDRLATNLEGLFEIFHVAATEVERDRIEEKSFEEKINPIVEKLHDIEQQNKDIAEGILALADIIKGKRPEEDLEDLGNETITPEPQMPSSPPPSSPPPSIPPPSKPSKNELPPLGPPPPPPK